MNASVFHVELGNVAQATVMDVGLRVLQLRKERRLTRKVLAARSGLSARGIEDIEKGTSRSPGVETLKALARALGVELDELVEPADSVQRLRLIRLLADPGETPDDVTRAMMEYLRKLMMQAAPDTDRG